MKKIWLLLFNLTLIAWFFSFLKVDICRWAEDLMEKAFTPAREYDTIVDMWNTKNAVWNEVLRDWVSVSIWWEKLVNTNKEAPLIVRITKLLLRLTIVLAITMVIYSGINYILQSTSGGDTKWSTKNLMLIAWWIIVALLSLAIIQLINSFAVNSLNIESFTPATENTQTDTGANNPTGWGWGGGWGGHTLQKQQ